MTTTTTIEPVRTEQSGHRPDQTARTAADDMVVEHTRLRIEAELAWHRMVLDQAGKLAS